MVEFPGISWGSLALVSSSTFTGQRDKHQELEIQRRCVRLPSRAGTLTLSTVFGLSSPKPPLGLYAYEVV